MTAYTASPKTPLQADDLQQILRHYSLRLRDFAAIPQGTINSNYSVHTDEGQLFLRVCEGRSLADAGFEASLIWHLGTRGLPTPALWRTRSGSPFVMFRWAKPVMLFSWVPGHQRSDDEIDESYAFHIGELLAQLHLCTVDFRQPHVGIYTQRHIQERLFRLQQDARSQAAVGSVLSSLQRELQILTRSRLPALPRGIAHGDLFPDNLLFPRKPPRHRLGSGITPKEQSGFILDLEQAATQPFVYDLAVSLLACCAPAPPLSEHTATASDDAADAIPPVPSSAEDPGTAPAANTASAASDDGRIGPLRLTTARAMVAGYQSVRALSADEWQGLYWELRFAAVRFTVTRLTDVHRYGTATPRGVAPGKDFRDFLWRLHHLIATDADQLSAHLRQPF